MCYIKYFTELKHHMLYKVFHRAKKKVLLAHAWYRQTRTRKVY